MIHLCADRAAKVGNQQHAGAARADVLHHADQRWRAAALFAKYGHTRFDALLTASRQQHHAPAAIGRARTDIGTKQLPWPLLFDPELCLKPRKLKLKLLKL